MVLVRGSKIEVIDQQAGQPTPTISSHSRLHAAPEYLTDHDEFLPLRKQLGFGVVCMLAKWRPVELVGQSFSRLVSRFASTDKEEVGRGSPSRCNKNVEQPEQMLAYNPRQTISIFTRCPIINLFHSLTEVTLQFPCASCKVYNPSTCPPINLCFIPVI